MSARARTAGAPSVVAAVAAALVLLVTAGAFGDDEPTAEEAVERARALVRQGQQADAEEYLATLVREEGGPHARDPEVLLEAARLSTSGAACRAYAQRAIENTRDSSVIEAARMLMGDSYFAESLYLSASIEYEHAARHASQRGPGEADLKRARSILASGDAGAAAEAYREIADWGATPNEVTAEADVGLGRALLEAGRPIEAAEQFETAARIHEDGGIRRRALKGAAESHEASGHHAEAVAALELLLAGYPDSYEGVLAREKLRTYAVPDSSALLGDAPDTTGTADAPGDSAGR